MSIAELLAEAEARGAEFTFACGRLACHHPVTPGIEELLDAISAQQTEAIALLDWRAGLGAGLDAGRVVAISRGYHARLLRCAAERRLRARGCGNRILRRPLCAAARDEVRAAAGVRRARPRVIAAALECRALLAEAHP